MRGSFRLSLSAIALPLIAGAGSIVAWTHWRPPLQVPGQQELTHSLGGLGPLGTGLAASHGFGTTHGVVGLVAAIGCLAGAVGMLLPGRLRMIGAVVVALSSVAIAANGLSAFLSANHLHGAWNSVVQAVGSGSTATPLSGVTSAISRNALAPAAGATGAGLVGMAGGLNALRSGLRSLGTAVQSTGMRPRIP